MFVQTDFSKTNNNNGHGHQHHPHHRAIDIVTPSNHNRHSMNNQHNQSDDLFKDLDLISRFCMPICSRDNDVREGALEAIAKTVEGWLDGVGSPKHYRLAQTADRRRLFTPIVTGMKGGSCPGSNASSACACSNLAENAMFDVPPEYLDLIALHLPIILRLSISCPFINVREKCQHILDIVQSRGLPIPYPVIYGPCAFVDPQELPPLGTYNEKTTIFKIKSCISNVQIDTKLRKPRKLWRRVFYKIIMHFLYECALLVVLCISLVLLALDIHTRGGNFNIMIGKGVVFIIYFLDFVMKIISYSHIYVHEGFQRYYMNEWDQFDFAIIVLLFFDIICVYFIQEYLTTLIICIAFYTWKSFVAVHAFKMVKALFILKRSEIVIMSFMDKLIGLRIMLAVDIGQAMIRSYDEVIHRMPTMIEHSHIRAELTQKAREDRFAIKLELVNRTSERDWVMVTCKTRLVIRNCFYAIQNRIFDMWTQGYIDTFDHEKLINALEVGLQNFLKLKLIQKPTDEEIVFNLGFLQSDEVSYYCYVNSQKLKYEKGDEIVQINGSIDGLLIMTSGLVQVTFTPTDCELYVKYGALPGIDELDDDNLFLPRSYYITCGNILGEMGILTKRPYHCTVYAIEPSEFIAIPKKILIDASKRRADTGVWSLMWNHITMKLLVSILWNTKPFHSATEEEVLAHIITGFYTDLSNCDEFERTKSVEDIILVEGIVQDSTTLEFYVAPCHLPRHVQRVILHRRKAFMVQPQLYFIPLDASLTSAVKQELVETIKLKEEILELH